MTPCMRKSKRTVDHNESSNSPRSMQRNDIVSTQMMSNSGRVFLRLKTAFPILFTISSIQKVGHVIR